MSTEDELRARIDALEDEVADLRRAFRRRGVRKRSDRFLWGMPLYDIAVGPDPDSGEVRGHARGVIAVGDIATGVLAVGGLARGLVAVGGATFGGICLGGCSIGILLGAGGFAIGALAMGGCAIGLIALGGAAVGYYACGGGAFGQHVIDGLRQDPEAVRFFTQWIPGMDQLLQRPGG